MRRRRLQDEDTTPAPESAALDELLTSDARERILSVRKSLRELAAMLAQRPGASEIEFALEAPAVKPRAARTTAAPKSSKRKGK